MVSTIERSQRLADHNTRTSRTHPIQKRLERSQHLAEQNAKTLRTRLRESKAE